MKHEELSGLRLLIVDDDAMVREVIARTVRGCGIEVEMADGGATATALLADNDYDVVVTDLKMPGVSGLEVMDRVRESHPTAALIVITGFATDDMDDRVTESGGLLLHKPFNRARLLGALQWARDRLEASR